jgi:type IV pilus biogenesis protein CpaD/CtpE
MNLRRVSTSALVFGSALLLIAGCKKTADNTSNYKSAINTYYSAHPACLWSQPQKFPVQIGASDSGQNAPYAALVDQGLLTRDTSEKKIIIVSRQEINYDLSSKGRSAWTADTTQPGYGNFCYGQRSVSSIDSSTPNNGQPGATTTVAYHYTVSNAPAWATASETQNAFPNLQASLAGGSASATLIDTNNGWQIQTPPPSPTGSNDVDGKIVQ